MEYIDFNQKLENLLSKNKDLLDQEGILLKQKIKALALSFDEELIGLLLSDIEVKEHFFKEIGKATIFDYKKFIDYIEDKNFLLDSYTKFSNKIGLTVSNKHLKQIDDVVLSFPFKDCVLEGGQTKEDEKRKEIFFNEVLAKDEINRLLDKKVIANATKYYYEDHEVQETKEFSFSRDENGTIKDNLIIKGNNLLALHTLKSNFAGKVKLIYIDPPYNTGNDAFKYNDSFRRSTWLTFMKNRLEIAKELLDISGTIAISIDNNEQSYLQVLLDEVFGSKNKKNLITVKRSSVSGAKVINNGVVNVSEYIVIYSKDTNYWKPNKVFRAKERDERYNKFILNKEDGYIKWEFSTVLEAFASFKGIKKSQLRKQLDDSYEEELNQFCFNNSTKIFQFVSLDNNSVSKEVKRIKAISIKDPSKTFKIDREKHSDYYIHHGKALLFFDDRVIMDGNKKVFGELITDIWDDVLPNDLHNEGGVSFKKGKKPEKLLQRLIELFSNQNDIVLDYHLGSGTTCAVSHKLHRQYIGIEQMNYGDNDSLVRMVNTINNEQSGITKIVNWQGGGEFIYFELDKYNQEFIDDLSIATEENILEIYSEITKKGFLNYDVELKRLEENFEAFKALSLEDKKEFLVSILNKNMLYKNLTEIDDTNFKIDEHTKKLNRDFYNLSDKE